MLVTELVLIFVFKHLLDSVGLVWLCGYKDLIIVGEARLYANDIISVRGPGLRRNCIPDGMFGRRNRVPFL